MPLITTGGVRIAYEERGSGEPLLLVSGIGLQLVSWPDGFLDRLAARGLRVIVFDNRDVGHSTWFDDAGLPRVGRLVARRLVGLPARAPYTLFDMARDAAGLLDALGLARAHVAGVSMGGMIAQAMAIDHGPRMKSLTSLMSQSAGALFTGRPQAAARLLRRAPRSRDEAIEAQIAFFRAAGSTAFHRDEAALRERAGRSYDRAFHPAGFARQLAAVLATGDLRPRLRGVGVPTLVLHGTADGIFRPACGRETARSIPRAELRLIDGWGHDLAEGVWGLLVDAIAGHVLAHAGEGS